MKLWNWVNNLGTKSGRRDIWVIFLTIVGVSCLYGFAPCQDNTILMTIIGGMFADLVGGTASDAYKYNIQNKYNKRDERSSNPTEN